MKTINGATRRRFFLNAGAILSAPLAVGVSQAASNEAEDSKLRLARLEASNAIREVNQAFARHLNDGDSDALRQLFTNPAGAEVDASVRWLQPSGFGEQDRIEVAADGQSARATIRCVVQSEKEIGPNCTLVDMARQQGEGVLRQTAQRVLENEYRRQDGVWKIEKSVFRPV